MTTKTTNAAFMIERDKILQGIVCFLCDGEVPSASVGCVSEYHPCS
jgi:hypothetical protein